MDSRSIHAIDQLAHWFERQKRVLPWRDQPSIYRVWISEIMLQQTQVVTVVPYFERFIARFPTVEVLADATEEEVMLSWAGLGYYSRARNLHQAAQQIVAQGFPNTREEWLKIPGVGPYTAGAILSIALNQPEAILDGNVERVLSRIYRIDRQKGDVTYKESLWERARNWVQDGFQVGIAPSILNQALMELGATYCSVRSPQCGQCPLESICEAKLQGDAEMFPPHKAPKKWIPVTEELHCVLRKDGHILVQRRQLGQWRAGLWDFIDQNFWQQLPKTSYEWIGRVETRHVVTRHRVSRITHVWKEKTTRAWKAAENFETELRWIHAENPEVPVGSAMKKVMKEISRLSLK